MLNMPITPPASDKPSPAVYRCVVFDNMMLFLVIATFLILIPALPFFVIAFIISTTQATLSFDAFFHGESYQVTRIAGSIVVGAILLNRALILGKVSGVLYKIEILFNVLGRNIHSSFTKQPKA